MLPLILFFETFQAGLLLAVILYAFKIGHMKVTNSRPWVFLCISYVLTLGRLVISIFNSADLVELPTRVIVLNIIILNTLIIGTNAIAIIEICRILRAKFNGIVK